MHFTPLWTPSPFAHSEGLGILFVYRIADPEQRAIAGDMSLIKAGWLPMPAINALQFYAPLVESGPIFEWVGPVDTIDIVSLRSVPSVQELLDDMYKEGVQRASSDGLLRLLEALFELVGDRESGQIEQLLHNVRPEALAPEFLVGILRATANSRNWIPSWEKFRETVHRELGRRRLDADQILIGLGQEGFPVD